MSDCLCIPYVRRLLARKKPTTPVVDPKATTGVKDSKSSNSKIMKAVRVHKFGAPDVLTVEENVPIPDITEEQVLVRVHHAGVNPVDTLIRAGHFPYLPPTPYTPGGDLAGVVERVGAKVTSVKYAQYAAVGATTVWPLHESLSFAQGAALGVPYGVAYRALFFKCHARPGETLLVHGASGAVGIAAVQMAHSLGLTVFGTAGTDDGMAMVKKQGADHVYNHRNKGYEKEVLAATGGKGVNIILEMASDKNMNADVAMLQHSGRIAVIGSKGSIDFQTFPVIAKEATIVGVATTSNTPKEWHEFGTFLVAGARAGWLRPVVDKSYALKSGDVAQSHKDVLEHANGARGKLTINMA